MDFEVDDQVIVTLGVEDGVEVGGRVILIQRQDTEEQQMLKSDPVLYQVETDEEAPRKIFCRPEQMEKAGGGPAGGEGA